ncbi:nuclear receptor-interacting protein 2 isoform X1 [Eschrichtius robustus]|uniref:nuclear receptor-interacting protein 2 isoform X1 n=1 Tax=Eschrichtius robustus TaxID=9764 RepID=UPI0035BF1CB1
MSVRPDAPREEGDAGDRGQEAEPRGRASSRQRQRRQATRFLHKDSADLLPLDGLKRLGTSKDWQPHNVIQRRLVEGNPSRPLRERPLVQAAIHSQESRRRTSKTERPALLVNCKCQDQVLQVAVDTGTHYNQISAGCLSRLGLGKRVLKAPAGDLAPGPPAQVEPLELQLGQATVACSARVVGKSPLRQHPRVSALAALPPGRGEGRASQLLPAQTRYPQRYSDYPQGSLAWGGGGSREGASADRRTAAFSNGSRRCGES